MVGARRGRGGGGGGQRPGLRRPPLPPPVLADRAGVSAELRWPGVGAVPGPPPPPGNSLARPGARQKPPCRDPAAPLARASLPGRLYSAGPGRWAQKSRSLQPPFLTLCLPTLVSSRPAPRLCQLSFSSSALRSLHDFHGPSCPPRLQPPLPGSSAFLALLVFSRSFFCLFSAPATPLPPAAPDSPSFLVSPSPPPSSTAPCHFHPQFRPLSKNLPPAWHLRAFGNVFGTVSFPLLFSDLCCRKVQISPDSTLGKDRIKDENAYSTV